MERRVGLITIQISRVVGYNITPLKEISLLFTLESEPEVKRKTMLLHFVVVRAASKNIIILRRTTMLKIEVVASTIHGLVKFPTESRIATIRAIKKVFMIRM